MLNTYHYILINKKTRKVEDFKVYKVPKTEDEMRELTDKFNDLEFNINKHLRITDSLMIQVIEKALLWRSSKNLDDISEQLREIEAEISGISYELRENINK